ncbi:hypothetical protein K523DRAFT_61754 [Schizophyllum commune Tattone D]|nr:hypothetical protein K523DRAFT_61754 [Schizophyllum commune Tattone D]
MGALSKQSSYGRAHALQAPTVQVKNTASPNAPSPSSAGLSAPWVGAWADTYGRKRACLAFCVSYALSCALIQFPFLPILFAGRALGGLSTSVLFSTFEGRLVNATSQYRVNLAEPLAFSAARR